MFDEHISEDKIRERITLLKRFLPYLEWSWPNEVRDKVYKVILIDKCISDPSLELKIKSNMPVEIKELARIVSDPSLEG